MEYNKTGITLHSSELAALWGSYLNDSMAACVLKYFLAKTEDPEFAEVIRYALHLSERHVRTVRDLFDKEGIPSPVGFTEEDVFVEAPRLYSDPFHMYYINSMCKIGMAFYGFSLSQITRSDVKAFYSECSQSTIELYNRVADVLLAKGLYIKPPVIPYPERVEFVENQSFLDGLIGPRRPLTATEISHLFANLQTNAIGHTLLIGFSQVASDPKVRAHLTRGRDIAKKHVKIFSSALTDEEIDAPMTWAKTVERTKEAPFSDKIMAYHATFLTSISIGNYGMAFGNSPRKDIAIDYARLSEEIAEYGNDGANIMIANGWLEAPPQTADRKALINA
ncbi:MAG TPA: DUF3231 family protein [Paenibacillus sp.]|nr:DUF3231 family protein [Paenibacillus sp.]